MDERKDVGPGTLNGEQNPDLLKLVEDANEKLVQAGAESAEQSFGLGCIVFALPLLVAVLLLFIFKVFNLILALIVLVMGALVIAGLVTLLAYNARNRTIGDIYQREVEPQIAQSLAQQHASRVQFDQMASEILPQDAPLRAWLAPGLTPEFPTPEE